MQYKKIIVRLAIITCIISGTMDLVTMRPADALRAMAALYFCIPLASLALTSSIKNYIQFGGLLTGVLLLVLSRGTVYPLIAASIFVAGSLFSIIHHNTLLGRRKKVTTWALAYVHSAIFCMVCAVAGTFSILGRGKTFNVTCDQVRTVVSDHIDTVLMPLRFTSDQIEYIQFWIDKFFTNSTDDLIQSQVSSQISSQFDEISQNANNPVMQSIIGKYKNMILNSSVGDKQNLDNKICNVVFSQIKERYQKPGFKLSVIISLVFFFYPLVRLFAVIYAAVLSIVYILLKRIGFITVTPEEKIVDTWSVGNDTSRGSDILSMLTFKHKVVEGQSGNIPGSFASPFGSPNSTKPDPAKTPSVKKSEPAGNSDINLEDINIPNTTTGSGIQSLDLGDFGGSFGKKPVRK